ncbi:MerR family transcriptional regulator [Flavobacteriaceae bacterium TK19130]|nr:MerR family transcriptional regulator [Thermobacterium salinum]
MHVKTQFSIKDLENLSGVKAHTIRIWEKRYNLLEPERTETNIREYDLTQLKKLLNVTYLYNGGYKISHIADMPPAEMKALINQLGESNEDAQAIMEIKKAMFSFDMDRFNTTYTRLSEEKSFTDLFEKIFIPVLTEIGTLWQTGTIDPAHERFISELIKQKMILNIEKLTVRPSTSDKVFCLFLPYGEIHEIGLLYVKYQLLVAGFKTIYLGQNIPLDNLKHLFHHYDNLHFLSYLTVHPEDKDIEEYFQTYHKEVCNGSSYTLYIMGAKTGKLSKKQLPASVKKIESFQALKKLLQTLKKS